MLKSKIAAALLVGLSFTSVSQAASISYFLDQSDKLADGINYLRVDINENASGAIDFTVTALQPLLDLAAEKGFGIVKFAFNAVPGVKLTPNKVDISSLPKGWVTGPHQTMAGFGKYDMRLRVTGDKTPLSDSISFSVIGIDFDTIASYVDLAINSVEGPSFFSARVAGLTLPCSESVGARRNSQRRTASASTCKPTDAFFGGATVASVPAPAALWLLGTGLAGLAVRRLRKIA
ncbi:MAG: PEP-CTERM sorting domain-containing protein [Gammaproteobacteria bacterium]